MSNYDQFTLLGQMSKMPYNFEDGVIKALSQQNAYYLMKVTILKNDINKLVEEVQLK